MSEPHPEYRVVPTEVDAAEQARHRAREHKRDRIQREALSCELANKPLFEAEVWMNFDASVEEQIAWIRAGQRAIDDAGAGDESMLQLAAKYGQLDAIRTLLGEFEASLGVTDAGSRTARTAVSLAAENGHVVALQLMYQLRSIKTMAEMPTPDCNGATPMILVAKNRDNLFYRRFGDTVDWMVEIGAEAAAYDNYMRSAISYACELGNEGIVARLLQGRLVRNNTIIQDFRGWTPYEHARPYPNIVALLEQAEQAYQAEHQPVPYHGRK